MTNPVSQAIELAIDQRDVPADMMRAAIGSVMDGECEDVLLAALLAALRAKGESVSELVGAARAMQDRATPITSTRTGLLDTCGTGGDHWKTFNISTAAALVIAAVGVPVAKHGNRSVSSTSGSADVLEALGVNVQQSPQAVGGCIDELGIGFCFAPLVHGAMKFAAPVRRQLGFRTIFNLLGPLTNPARAEYQLVGTTDPGTADRLARAMLDLGRKRALAVSGGNGLDEVSLWGETVVFDVKDGHITRSTWSAKDFGLPECDVTQLTVGSAEESAAIIRGILKGEPGPARDITVANASAGLITSERFATLKEGVAAAQQAIDSGRAQQTLQALSSRTMG